MRRIVSKQEEEQKQKRNQIIVGIILIVVMIFSTIGYSFQGTDSNSKKVKYNGYEFVYSNNYWVLEKDGNNFYFSYNPNELENFNSSVKLLENYISEPLYITSENPEFNSKVYLNFNNFATRIQLACLENSTCEGNLPVKNCNSNFIIFKESNVSEITQNNNCVYIRGEKQNILKLTDAFLLKVLGI